MNEKSDRNILTVYNQIKTLNVFPMFFLAYLFSNLNFKPFLGLSETKMAKCRENEILVIFKLKK